jgi:hypothetical protein
MRSTLAIDATNWDVPMEWRAPHGAVTPDGHLAQFRSPDHAVMAARIHYLNEHPATATKPVETVAAGYQDSWDRFTAHCRNVVMVANYVADNDLDAAADA